MNNKPKGTSVGPERSKRLIHKLRKVGRAKYHVRIAMAGPTKIKGCNLFTQTGESFSISQLEIRYRIPAPPTPQRIATSETVVFSARPLGTVSRSHRNPKMRTVNVTTGTTSETSIRPKASVSHSKKPPGRIFSSAMGCIFFSFPVRL